MKFACFKHGDDLVAGVETFEAPTGLPGECSTWAYWIAAGRTGDIAGGEVVPLADISS